MPTVLDHLTDAGHPVVAVGKIRDLFAGRGVTRHLATASDDEGMDRVEEAMRDVPRGLIWANLVDFDALYGHRNNVDGYARNLERFDARLADLLPQLRPTDLLVITADHGNDPDDAEHRPLTRVRAAAGRRAQLVPPVSVSALARRLPIWARPSPTTSACAPLPRGTSFLEALGDSSPVRPSA